VSATTLPVSDTEALSQLMKFFWHFEGKSVAACGFVPENMLYFLYEQ
jgi:hypothetical protein